MSMQSVVAEKVHKKLKFGGGVRCPKCGYTPEPGEVLRLWDKADVALAKVEAFDNVKVGEKIQISSGEFYWESSEYFEIICDRCDSTRVRGKKELLEKLRNCEYEVL